METNATFPTNSSSEGGPSYQNRTLDIASSFYSLRFASGPSTLSPCLGLRSTSLEKSSRFRVAFRSAHRSGSMAIAQLYGCSGTAARGLPLAPSMPRVASSPSSDWVDIKSKRFKSPRVHLSQINGRKFPLLMCLNGSGSSGVVNDTIVKNSQDKTDITDEPVKSDQTLEAVDEKLAEDLKQDMVPHKRSAKIHDFCLGIPFGGIVSVGGLLGFVFSRNPANLFTGVFLGGATFALGVISLKVWRSGKSSLPYILGQTAIAVALLRNHMQTYSLTKKLFPAGFYIFLSATMICFYSYVVISGGNPPPKKKVAAPAS